MPISNSSCPINSITLADTERGRGSMASRYSARVDSRRASVDGKLESCTSAMTSLTLYRFPRLVATHSSSFFLNADVCVEFDDNMKRLPLPFANSSTLSICTFDWVLTRKRRIRPLSSVIAFGVASVMYMGVPDNMAICLRLRLLLRLHLCLRLRLQCHAPLVKTN